MKPTDAIMSSQLLEFERFSRYGFVGRYVESLASEMQSFPLLLVVGDIF